jgi:arylsulfatase
MQGLSWRPMLDGRAASPRTDNDWIGFEFWGMRAIRKGPWKLSWIHEPFGTEEWQLHNVVEDPGELVDLASAQPGILAEMIGHWEEYVAENNVILPNRHQYEGLTEQLPPRPAVAGTWPPGPEENYGEEEDDEFFTCAVKSK